MVMMMTILTATNIFNNTYYDNSDDLSIVIITMAIFEINYDRLKEIQKSRFGDASHSQPDVVVCVQESRAKKNR